MPRHLTFSRLVENDKDFIGMVAYTVYKKNKLNWISEYKLNHGVEPTQDELDNGFNLDTDTPLKLQRYRSIAESMLNDFMDETISYEVETYQKNVLNEAIVKAVKRGF